MDYFEYTKKGFPLLAGAVVYFLCAGLFLALIWPTALALFPGLILLAMSLPRVYRRPTLFQSLRSVYYTLLAGYFIAWVGKVAFRAGASIRRDELIGPFIFLGSLLIALSVAWLLRRFLERKRAQSPMAGPFFDDVSFRLGLSSVVGWLLISWMTVTR